MKASDTMVEGTEIRNPILLCRYFPRDFRCCFDLTTPNFRAMSTAERMAQHCTAMTVKCDATAKVWHKSWGTAVVVAERPRTTTFKVSETRKLMQRQTSPNGRVSGNTLNVTRDKIWLIVRGLNSQLLL